MLRLLGRALSTVCWAWAGLLVYAGVFGEGQIFLPPPPSYTADDPGVLLLPGSGPTERPVAARWWPGCENGTRAPLVLLYSHGNAEDLGQIAPLMRVLAAQGWAVLAYDYPGYGASPGPC
ncbi:MAG: serine aminopeptidase domain-containing protein, partial [Planctomycetota bacterium]